MKNQLVLLIGILVLTVLLAYMFMFQVPYDQSAVLATFEQTTPPTFDPETGEIAVDSETGERLAGSLIVEPGLYFKAPWPVQKVYTYPRKLQMLDVQPEQVQTDDGHAIIVKTYLTWRIVDPYAFYQSDWRTIENAESQLLPMVRATRGVFGRYNFTDLVNRDPSQVKLPEIEDAMAEALRESLRGRYGIEVEQVGIRRILLPEDTTSRVFERMVTTRERLATAAREEGQAQAATIRSEAERIRATILAFAERRAQAIRDEGNRESAAAFAAFAEDEDFAIFLRQIETLRNTLGNNTTLVLDADSFSFLNLFKDDPSQRDTPPSVTLDQLERAQQTRAGDDSPQP